MCNIAQQGSSELDQYGAPRGFFQPILPPHVNVKAYPVLFGNQMTGNRAQNALTYLQVRAYIDQCASSCEMIHPDNVWPLGRHWSLLRLLLCFHAHAMCTKAVDSQRHVCS